MPRPGSPFFTAVRPLAADPEDPAPKYLRICRAITAAIDAGRLAPGTALPSQRHMAEHLGVTVMTLRHALAVLESQDRLRVEHGLGTFVADGRYRLPIDRLASLTSQVRETGRTLRTEVVFAGPMRAPSAVAARLGLAEETVFCLTRLRLVDEVPTVYAHSLLPTALGERLDVVALGEGSLYDLLAERLDVHVTRAVETLHAALLSEDEARALRCDPGSAALVSSRLTYTDDGTAVVDDRAVMPGDRVLLSTERHAGDADLRLDGPLSSGTAG
ncbi:GntR family transcriptional regulator [Phycicoccus flavus]|uniref:GntR family transcriptional regulator n=1 Tax=Phycicoccus flavus TaxID=2502783 RepID=UPI000FEB6450|nr:GntR family transcriptional regulator [Phycicoccus flavus]NHA67967.1 GntR family transcriptional regulator [Phycicoccus flavus]